MTLSILIWLPLAIAVVAAVLPARITGRLAAAGSLATLAIALGGLMITARLEAGAATAGQGLELTVISAVVIGGVSLFGGEGKIAGVLQLSFEDGSSWAFDVPKVHLKGAHQIESELAGA